MTDVLTEAIIEEWINNAKFYEKEGELPDYIPALAEQDRRQVAMSVCLLDSGTVSAGKYHHLFTLQSVSKVLALALALMDNGERQVFDKVGMEPSGDPFNSIAKLETARPSKPLNPMINAGALVVTSLIRGSNPNEKIGRLLSFVRDLADDQTINYNEKVAQSEYDTAFLNRSLAYFMKQHTVITGSIEELLTVYTKQCAIEVNTEQLARIGAVFANNGVDLISGRTIIPEQLARICKTFMVTCGMYDASGSFATKVGIPAKSGVSGVILGSVKGFGGIAVFSPALDAKGNSVIGWKLLESVSKRYKLSIF